MFFKIGALKHFTILIKTGVLKSFTNFTGNYLCQGLFLKNLQAEGLQLLKKGLQHRCFSVKFGKFLKNLYLHNASNNASVPPWLLLYFYKDVPLNSYFATWIWRTNNFYFLTHRLMYKKSNSFVYKFVVNCQIF